MSIKVNGHNFGGVSVKIEIDEYFTGHESEFEKRRSMASELLSAACDILYTIDRSNDEFDAMIKAFLQDN